MHRDLKDSFYQLEALLQANISLDLKQQLFQKSTQRITGVSAENEPDLQQET